MNYQSGSSFDLDASAPEAPTPPESLKETGLSLGFLNDLLLKSLYLRGTMVGRDMDTLFPKEEAERGKPVLQVERLTREGVFTDISFDVHAGEIVALAGLVGAGRSEIARAIFGIDRADAGTVAVNGKKLRNGSPTAAMKAAGDD